MLSSSDYTIYNTTIFNTFINICWIYKILYSLNKFILKPTGRYKFLTTKYLKCMVLANQGTVLYTLKKLHQIITNLLPEPVCSISTLWCLIKYATISKWPCLQAISNGVAPFVVVLNSLAFSIADFPSISNCEQTSQDYSPFD